MQTSPKDLQIDATFVVFHMEEIDVEWFQEESELTFKFVIGLHLNVDFIVGTLSSVGYTLSTFEPSVRDKRDGQKLFIILTVLFVMDRFYTHC